jgi:hypothetical protein
MLTPFETKDEYLLWVSYWKSDYAEITAAIRALKQRRKPSHPEYSINAASAAVGERATARQMLDTRKEMKAVSWQMKLAMLAKSQV